MKRRMLAAAQRRIVVADGSKVGRRGPAHLCDACDIDLLVTDPSADAETLACPADLGLKVRMTS